MKVGPGRIGFEFGCLWVWEWEKRCQKLWALLLLYVFGPLFFWDLVSLTWVLLMIQWRVNGSKIGPTLEILCNSSSRQDSLQFFLFLSYKKNVLTGLPYHQLLHGVAHYHCENSMHFVYFLAHLYPMQCYHQFFEYLQALSKDKYNNSVTQRYIQNVYCTRYMKSVPCFRRSTGLVIRRGGCKQEKKWYFRFIENTPEFCEVWRLSDG